MHWIIAPIFLATVPLLGLLSSVLSRRIKKVQTEIVKETTALAGSTTESLRNIELVKSLGLGDQEVARLNSTTDQILQLELKKVRYLRSLSFVQGTAVNALRTSILFLMLYLIFTQDITVGQFFSLFIYSFFIFGPLQELGNVDQHLPRDRGRRCRRSSRSCRTRRSSQSPRTRCRSIDLQRSRSRTCGSRTRPRRSPALAGVSFAVRRGETVAFVGPSGSGKTTLVKLLVGLYRPQAGEILYDGHRHDEVDLDALRERIGFVTQDTQLFSGSIRENLLFVRPDATDAECLAALRARGVRQPAGAGRQGARHGDRRRRREGLRGERQRLSIARALLRRPHLLVFDEATSSLDSITEEEISQTIRDVNRAEDAITILIAHRLSTVMHADRIYVLEHGRIVERGRHDELVALKGLYYAMWRQQVGERRDESLSSLRPGVATGGKTDADTDYPPGGGRVSVR